MKIVTSINAILSEHEITPNEAPYQEVGDYVVDMGDFFAIEPIWGHRDNFVCFDRYAAELAEKNRELQLELDELQTEIKCSKANHTDPFLLKNLRERKKAVSAAIAAEAQHFYAQKEKYVITYKNIVTANTFKNITELIPQLSGVKNERLYKMPLFTRNLTKLCGVDFSETAVVGGPCLFGADEMKVMVTHSGGAEYCFDFVTDNQLSEHFSQYSAQIVDVSFKNLKTKITVQEVDCISFPMEVASVLGASFVYPIPDMSYIKYMEAASAPLNTDLRLETIAKFRREAYSVADTHISLFERTLSKYNINRTLLLHERNTEALNIFYTEREKYFNGVKLSRRGFAHQADKNESVYDYISCLAMPYYAWGVKNIIQVDSVDETNAMEKCAKVHKKEFTMSGMMFPEIMSKNGVDTVFNAPKEFKLYE
ncbi:MAG: hypothetical protein FWG90_08820 [Oscillospiraceae bacterium]|nr:hypothetical protein [Oscillospiraceae bacterium]